MQVHAQLVRALTALIPQEVKAENIELMKQATAFIKENDVLEDMGSHQVNTIVHFCPEGATRFRAKVMRAYGTPKGKVFYDLALAHVNKDGVEVFADTLPIRGVSPYYVFAAFDQERAKDVGTGPKVFSLDAGNVDPAVAVTQIQNAFKNASSDPSVYELPTEHIVRSGAVIQQYVDQSSRNKPDDPASLNHLAVPLAVHSID